MLNNLDNFKNETKNILFTFGQRLLGEQLKKKYGEMFLWENNEVDLDLFNPLAFFDMLDFYKNNGGKCCCRWGWPERDVQDILNTSYTIHLYNTIIKKLDEKYRTTNYLLGMLEELIYN